MTNYLGVSLPITLLKRVDEKITIFSYSSRADFIKEAIRRELQRLDKIEKKYEIKQMEEKQWTSRTWLLKNYMLNVKGGELYNKNIRVLT